MFDDRFKERYKTIPFAYVSHDYEKEENHLHGNRIFHHHKEFEILIIRAGNALLRIEGEAEGVPLAAGDVVLIPPFLPHCYSKEREAVLSHDCVCFDLSLLCDRALAEGLEDGTLRPPAVLFAREEGAGKIFSLVRAAVESCKTAESGWELETVADISRIFALLLRRGLIRASGAVREGFCTRVIALLEEHYGEDISSSFIADRLYMSHAYFCRRFRAEFGLRFMEYLAMYRVEKSKPLLRGGLPISEIALAVGFRSFSHFTKTFRTYVGKTPSAYRAGHKA